MRFSVVAYLPFPSFIYFSLIVFCFFFFYFFSSFSFLFLSCFSLLLLLFFFFHFKNKFSYFNIFLILIIFSIHFHSLFLFNLVTCAPSRLFDEIFPTTFLPYISLSVCFPSPHSSFLLSFSAFTLHYIYIYIYIYNLLSSLSHTFSLPPYPST